jgi:isorenieratene synthase
VVELHAYALVEQADDQQLKDQLLTELHRVYPELEPAGIEAEEFLINNDCPLHGIDPWHQRLTVETPHPRIMLAGDGIRCDFPVALMERAATTGFLAANQLLSSWEVAGHDIWTVPMRSRHRGAPALRSLLTKSG